MSGTRAGESYGGITVPQGDPAGLRTAAQHYAGAAGTLGAASASLQGMPGMVGGWQGPASVCYAGTCHQNAAAATTAQHAMHHAQHTAMHYADELEEAQRDAAQAIDDARDAQRRIDKAKADIAQAQADQEAAARAADVASHQLTMSSIGGTPSPTAQAALDAAGRAADDAAARERAARRALEDAEDDLRRARRRGEHAAERARNAATAAGGALATVAPGMVNPAMPGAPATPTYGETHGPFLYDTFLKPFDPWAKRDSYGATRFWTGYAYGVPSALTGKFFDYASKHWMVTKGMNHFPTYTVDESGGLVATGETLDKPKVMPDWDTRAKWAGRAKVLKGAGLGVSVATAGLDEFMRDRNDPSLSGTEVGGRVAANAATVAAGGWAGAEIGAATGAAIGGAIFPPGGEIVGGIVGGIVGSGVGGAVADRFNDTVVKGVGDAADKVGDVIGSIF